MRLALFGPTEGHGEALENAARFALEKKAVDRAVYLHLDGALDSVVNAWAARLVGGDPNEEELWGRAARACLRAKPGEIDEYLSRERAREALRIFESLPDADTRAVEMLGGALVVMIHDKAKLNEEDMLPARVLVFGKSKAPVVKQVGQRWFLSPGSFAEAGLLVLEDADDGILLSLYDRECNELRTEQLSTHRATKLTVGAGA